ncbi:hypothetical protein FVEG_15848 [Fusarium verticillioides 7600]|uniref:Uncharacterized protein n=1 Tax=Gibberella moniliformis (strain M3125 / FGSC 7600) TaxID=334819 RepID=W7M278_GIBM7|nr:hypothetical protein FVEG_15848 [Fusarium verticillioides 7600]EWG45678.1 hypothetical protein FVEG_15848 [Fusarium verticillioides 7600]
MLDKSRVVSQQDHLSFSVQYIWTLNKWLRSMFSVVLFMEYGRGSDFENPFPYLNDQLMAYHDNSPGNANVQFYDRQTLKKKEKIAVSKTTKQIKENNSAVVFSRSI